MLKKRYVVPKSTTFLMSPFIAKIWFQNTVLWELFSNKGMIEVWIELFQDNYEDLFPRRHATYTYKRLLQVT